MTFAEATVRWQRWLLAAMLAGSVLTILPAAVEPFMLPKATVVVWLAVGLLGLGAARAAWSRAVHLPTAPVVIAVAVFAAALLVTTVTSPSPWTSLVGVYSRYTGLIPYLAYVLAFLVLLRVTDVGFVRVLTRAALVTLGVVVAYGLLQAAGLDPIDYNQTNLGTTFSLLGNTNFGGAWAGAVTALALVTALSRDEHRGWRLYATLLLPLALLYVLLTKTSQGPIVALAALSWATLVLATGRGSGVREFVGARRRTFLVAASAAVLVGSTAVAAALPFLRAQLDQSLVERPDFWAAAVAIFADRPVLGTGLDTYAHHFQVYRPVGHALANGTATTNAPHSVPLGMFSNGGLLLGLTYLAVVLLVGAALVRGLTSVHGAERQAFAAWGGVWLGYQLQSLISMDVPPLAMLHWMSAGVVVALAAPPRWRLVRLPGPAAARPLTKKGKEYGDYVVPTSTRVLQGAVGLIAVGMVWVAAYPLRADVLAASAAPLASSGRINQAVVRFDRAASLNPGEASYLFLAARGEDARKRPERSLRFAAEAADRDPGTVQYSLFAAGQAEQLRNSDLARRWYADAVSRDPKDPVVLMEAAKGLLRLGDPPAAQALLNRSLALRTDPPTLLLAARARSDAGDLSGARAALEQALKLEPGNAAAQRALAALPDAA